LWVQLAPLLVIPAVMILFRGGYTHRWLLPLALGWYVLAKAAEAGDAVIFHATGGLVSGHPVKHLLAAAGCYTVLVMLQKRKPARRLDRDADVSRAGHMT
jgi:hypothetical protein